MHDAWHVVNKMQEQVVGLIQRQLTVLHNLEQQHQLHHTRPIVGLATLVEQQLILILILILLLLLLLLLLIIIIVNNNKIKLTCDECGPNPLFPQSNVYRL